MVGSKTAPLPNRGWMVAPLQRKTFGTQRTNGTQHGKMADRCRSRASRCGSKAVTMVVLREYELFWVHWQLILAHDCIGKTAFNIVFGIHDDHD